MLEVRGLHVSYGSRPVLRGIDVVVGRGEVVSLVGPNGSGKTTLLRAITRVVPWTRGDVLVGGRSVARLSRKELARLVAVVPQSVVLPIGYTALEVVLMGRTPHLGFLAHEGPGDVRIAMEALELVGAAEFADRRVDELSGGERQRVVLARALAQEAPVLLLDEATANLDIGHQISTLQLVRRLARERGYAVVAAIHDLTLAGLYTDRMELMCEGRIVCGGPPRHVLEAQRLATVYGAAVTVLCDDCLPGPVVVPYADGAVAVADAS